MGIGTLARVFSKALAKVFSEFCTSGEVVLESCIFDKISKQLQVDSEGVLFTRCLVQNPPPVWSSLPVLVMNFLFPLNPSWPLTPSQSLPWSSSRYQILRGSLVWLPTPIADDRGRAPFFNFHGCWVAQSWVSMYCRGGGFRTGLTGWNKWWWVRRSGRPF